MHEPGPPRATTVGETVELAPRSPDPSGAYYWTLIEAPSGSAADPARVPDASGDDSVLRNGETSRDDTPVVHLHPDVPGEYVLELDAPDGTHRQRVRAYPDERLETTLRVPASDLGLPDDEVETVSVMAAFNDRLLARDRPERDGDDWVWETRLPPGRHRFSFVANDDLIEGTHRAVQTVDGPGRPHCSLHASVTESDIHLTAEVGLPPNSPLDPVDADVTFLVDDRDASPGSIADVEDRSDGHELTVPITALRTAASSDTVRIHAVPHAERLGAMATVEIRFDGDGVVVSDPHATPDWATSPTIYEVYVRSFAGDTLPTTFSEIERRVPYLDSLGIDVLWLTPVLASPTEHGYHITDFFETAADLGTRADFESLVEACHTAGIRVVFDLVINHTSRDHPFFQLHSAGVDAYRDHYRRVPGEFDVTDTDWSELEPGDMPEYYFNWRRIPNLNFDSPEVRSWLLDVVEEWAAVVDGFRCDVAWGVPHGFWKEVADRTHDEFLLLDETIPHDPFYGEGAFDLHYDTSLYHALGGVGAGERSADAIADAVDRGRWLGFSPGGFDQMRYIENHDENRYLAVHGEAAQRAAGAVTFTLPGAPMIYAGQERGNDRSRGPMKWHDGDNSLTEFYRRLSALRDDEPLLRTGDLSFIPEGTDVTVVDGDPDRVVAYTRGAADGGDDHHAGETLLVVVNFADAPVTVELPPAYTDATDRFDGVRPSEDRLTVETVAVLSS